MAFNNESLARATKSIRAALDDYRTGKTSDPWRANFMRSVHELKRMGEEDRNAIHVSSSRITTAERQFQRRHGEWLRAESCNALGDAFSMLECGKKPDQSCKITSGAMSSLGCMRRFK